MHFPQKLIKLKFTIIKKNATESEKYIDFQ